MQITSQRPAPALAIRQKPSPATSHKEIDEKDFSWLDLGKGLTGSAMAGTIEGVGGLTAGLIKSPRITYEAVKGTWKSKMLGPVLKSTLTPVILTAGVAAPALTALVGTGFGMLEGFIKGAEENPLAAGSQAIETCKKMHGRFTQSIVDGIRDLASKEPETPEDVYEINLLEAGQGLVGAAAAATIDGVAAPLSLAWNLPHIYGQVSEDIWKSDISVPLKVGSQVLASAASVVALPLTAVGGALYGLGKGAYDGYQQGPATSIHHAVDSMREWNDSLSKLPN
ncbi:hypothetical protein JST97_06500 [bacterium]|nr:hypothetical protein [bacterium]